MSPLPLKKIFDPNKIPPQKNTEDNFYEVQTTKCTKTLYKTDTIRPTVHFSRQYLPYTPYYILLLLSPLPSSPSSYLPTTLSYI